MSKALRIISLILCFTTLSVVSAMAEDAVFDDTFNIMEEQPTFSGADIDTNIFGDLKAEGPISFTEIEDVRLRHKADVLYNFGFMSCYPDGTFRIDANVTKGDFICSVLLLLNYKYVQNDDDPYTNAVKAAYNLGIVVGDENNRVNPNEYVSYTDACTMLIRALGYENNATLNGGYPFGYLNIARSIGLYVTAAEQMTRADVCNMLYSALNAPLMKKIVYGEVAQYEANDAVTVLSCYHDMYIIEDRVNANYISALPGYNTTSSDMLAIGNDTYYVSKNNYCEFLGYYVEAYYTVIDGIKEITYITKSSDVEELVINADDIQGFSDLKYKYYIGDKLCSDVIAKHHVLIINGVVIKVYNDNDFIPRNGNVTLLSYNNNDYDVVIIESFYPFILEAISTDQSGNPQFLSMFSLPLYKLDLKSDVNFSIYVNDIKCSFYSQKIETYDPDANKIVQYQMPSVPVNCVVNIFADKYDIVNGVHIPSLNAKTVTFKIYTDRVITGKVETVGDDELLIDGSVYETAVVDLFKYAADKLSVGSTGEFLLDYDGKICAYISGTDTTKLQYAYLINAVPDETQVLDDKVIAKLLLASGAIKTYDIYNKVRINGTKAINSQAVISALQQSAGYIKDDLTFTVSQLIKFKCNSTGEISEIETVLQSVDVPSGEDENHIHRENVRASYASRSENGNSLYFNSGNYSGMLAYNGKPGLHFKVPNVETFNDADYSVSTSWGVNMSVKVLDVYNCSNNLVPEVIVEYCDVDSALDYPYVLVESTGQGIDEEGNEVAVLKCVTGHTNTGWLLESGNATYYSYDKELFNGLKCGDFIYLYGTGKYISKYDMVMSIDTVENFDMSVLPTPAETSQKYDLYELYAIWESYNFILQRGPVTVGTKREYQQINYFNKLVDYGGFVYDCTGKEPKVSALYTTNIMDAAINHGNDKASRVFIWESSTVTKLIVVYIGI